MRVGDKMISHNDFEKKQIIFVFCNDGEKIAINNDNLAVKDSEGKIKLTCTCYRIFLVYIIGNCSMTTVLLQKAKKYGFFIALMTPGFRMYEIIGAEKSGNTLLHRKQYQYDKQDIAKHIIANKIENQTANLQVVRDKSDALKEAILMLKQYQTKIFSVGDFRELMAYEGLASKVYFKNHFNNICWSGRQPRIKSDVVNTVLDMAYSLLFTFLDSLLESFGFDTFCGVMHKQFYLRKSLVCDIIEPFRPMMDRQVKKAFNLKQIKEEDFLIINHQFRLKWEENFNYVSFLMKPIIERRNEIFFYIHAYYRAFMKEDSIDNYPVFKT